MKHTKFSLGSVFLTSIFVGLMGSMIAGVDPLHLIRGEGETVMNVPQAHAWGGSTWRRVRREARRARDRVRREIERARQHVERETKRVAVRVREGDLRVNLDSLDERAVQYLSSVSTATAPFLPVSQIVSLSLAALEYERVLQEMEALEVETVEVDRAQQRLDHYESTLRQLETVQVDPNLRMGLLPPPAGDVQTAPVAQMQHQQLGEYMATLVIETAFYEHVQGEVPRRRPVTLMSKIGQALIDYAQLKEDIRLISQTQQEHAGLYDTLVTRGSVNSVAGMLRNALTYLETMPVSGLPDPPIRANSQVGRLLQQADAQILEGETLIASHYAFPLLVAPTQLIATMNTTLRDITHDRRNSSTAWILLLPQHEIDALDQARERLTTKRDQLAALHIPRPQELVSLFLLETIAIWPRYQQLQPVQTAEAGILLLEMRQIRERLQFSLNLVQSQHLPFSTNLMSTVRQAIVSLELAERDLEVRSNALPQSPNSLPSIPTSSSSSSLSTAIPLTPAATTVRSSVPYTRVLNTKATGVRRGSKATKNRKDAPIIRSKDFAPMKDAKPMQKVPTVPASSAMSSVQSSVMFQIPIPLPPPVSSASSSSSEVSQNMEKVPVQSSSVTNTKTVPSVSSAPAMLPAPRLLAPFDQEYVEVTTQKIDVYGYVDNRTMQLLIQGKPSTSYKSGSGKFWVMLELLPGKNFFEIQAVDAQGLKSAAVSFVVIYQGK